MLRFINNSALGGWAMDDRAPSIDSAWAWLVGQVPADIRPLLGIAAAIAIILWLAINGLKSLLELIKVIRDLFRRDSTKRRDSDKDEVVLPPPRVSVWNPDVLTPLRPKLVKDGGIPIITTANMKGGVGKTTVTANVAAYFDAQGKRVLLIDFDYQGSLSQTVTAAANIDRIGSVVDDLVTGQKSIAEILQAAQPLSPAMPRSKILTCYYEFSDTETHTLVDWVVALRTGKPTDDVRFRLASLLRDDAVQKEFDIVLIDAPPRFSTGTINALCASTHLLIPTILDRMSVEAVIYFSRDVFRMKQKLFPDLKLIGVVPTMVAYATQFTRSERNHISTLNRDLAQYWKTDHSVLDKAFVPDKTAFSAISGSGIGYINAGRAAYTDAIRAIFDRVGKVIGDRIKA
jgi:cellulose biosynthesis protein BcsQ